MLGEIYRVLGSKGTEAGVRQSKLLISFFNFFNLQNSKYTSYISKENFMSELRCTLSIKYTWDFKDFV